MPASTSPAPDARNSAAAASLAIHLDGSQPSRNAWWLIHRTLRRPFYGQCYAAAPFALLLGIGTLAPKLSFVGADRAAAAIVVAGFAWYLATQVRWFARKRGVSLLVGLWDALVATIASIALFVVAAIIII